MMSEVFSLEGQGELISCVDFNNQQNIIHFIKKTIPSRNQHNIIYG